LREPAGCTSAADTGPSPKSDSKYFEGVIARAQDQTVTVALAGGAEVTFPVDQVDRAHLKFEW